MNIITLIGLLGQDPEFQNSGGKQRTLLRLATHKEFPIEDGTTKGVTTWHNVTIWGSKAFNYSRLLRKGDRILIQGEISSTTVEDAERGKKTFFDIATTRVWIDPADIKSPRGEQTGE